MLLWRLRAGRFWPWRLRAGWLWPHRPRARVFPKKSGTFRQFRLKNRGRIVCLQGALGHGNASSWGRFVQGTFSPGSVRPGDGSSSGHFIRGRFVQGRFFWGHFVWGRIVRVPKLFVTLPYQHFSYRNLSRRPQPPNAMSMACERGWGGEGTQKASGGF
jgi:hypothetical protein